MNYGGGGDYNSSGERYVLHYVKKRRSQPIIFDVGANVGGYTLDCISIFGDECMIHSFEPSKKTFELLLENIGERKNLILNNFGFGNRKEQVSLYSEKNHSGGVSIFNRDLEYMNIKTYKTEKISIDTIDNYIQENKIDKIDLLKLDIEGFEYNALLGSSQILYQKKLNTSNLNLVELI